MTTATASVMQRSISTNVIEPLAVFAVGIVDAEQFQAQHGHAHAEHLPGAQMSVGHFGVAQQFVEGLQAS